MSIYEVPMPPDDNNIFRCTLLVKRPPPVYWEDCGKVAIRAFKTDYGKLLSLRCEEHQLEIEHKF